MRLMPYLKRSIHGYSLRTIISAGFCLSYQMADKKKTGNPFEKGDIRRLIINGMLSMVVASVVSLLIACIRVFFIIGMDNIKLLMNNPDPETIESSLKGITDMASGQSYWSSFAGTFISV